MRNILAVFAALLVFAGGSALTASNPYVPASNEHGSYMDAINQDTEWAFGGGVIRLEPGTVDRITGVFSSGGPRIYANSTHISVGIRNIYVKGSGAGGGDLVIEHDSPGRITSISMDPDETLSQKAVGGVSGGVGTMVVRFYDLAGNRLYLHHQEDYDFISSPYSNFWLEWKGPKVRGSGGPSLSDRMAALEARVTALENP